MGVQEYARHILANKDKYSSTLVKRANFARNAKKFKHEDGGVLFAQSGTGNWLTGEITPISKRDNFQIPSILMGATPMIFGLNAISNNKNNKE